jgi:hypothetical protein
VGGFLVTIPKIEVLNAAEKNRGAYELMIDGERFVLDRVTSLLNGFPKPALGYAQTNEGVYASMDMALEDPDGFARAAKADREGLKKKLAGAAFPKWKRRAALGTYVHELAELHILGSGRRPLVPEGVDGGEAEDMFEQFLAWESYYKPDYLATEIQCVNIEHRYAGTADMLARVDGKTMILDIKTTKRGSDGGPGVYLEQGCQLAAYRNAEYLFDGRAGVTEAMPQVDGTAVVWIGRDGFELCPFDNSSALFDLFLHAAEVHRGMKKKDKNPAGGPWWRSADIIRRAS